MVARSLRGEREAFGRLYDRYARPARAVLGGDEDRVHEAFLRAFRNLPTLADPAAFGPWLVGIARRVRAERPRRTPEPLAEPEGVATRGGACPVEAADERAYLRSLVAKLPDEERAAVESFFLGGRDAEATAVLLGRSRSGVYALLKRALARLAERLGGVP